VTTIQIVTKPSLPPHLQLTMSVYSAFTLSELAGPRAALGSYGRTHLVVRTLLDDTELFILPTTSVGDCSDDTRSPDAARHGPIARARSFVSRRQHERPAHLSKTAGQGVAA
jgi:hypothetical protein